jgi:ketosteroid isomerase-like protein
MRRSAFLTGFVTAAAGLALMAGFSVAQQPSDVDAVRAANTAFYAALSARDAKAMENLWANKPYVINIGPMSKTIEVGYENAVAKYWSNAFTNVFTELKVTMAPIGQPQTDGKLAWVVGTEKAIGKTKSGASIDFDVFVTNVFEKDGNRWLMVSHHAGIQPK